MLLHTGERCHDGNKGELAVGPGVPRDGEVGLEVRLVGAVARDGLEAGRTQVQGLLLDPPEYLQTAKVFDLLLAVPKYGRVKVNRILTHCRISPSKTIGGLSERQRNELVSYLRR